MAWGLNGFGFRGPRGLHVQAQHPNGFLLSWCSERGGEPQAEPEDEACTSPRVAEALVTSVLCASPHTCSAHCKNRVCRNPFPPPLCEQQFLFYSNDAHAMPDRMRWRSLSADRSFGPSSHQDLHTSFPGPHKQNNAKPTLISFRVK